MVARRHAGRRGRASTSSTAWRRRWIWRAASTSHWCSSPPGSRRPRSPRRPPCCSNPPANFFVLSAHKYIPPVMEIVAEMPETRVEGFLAAGHAATITGWGVFERFVERHKLPVVVAGFEPLDILAGLAEARRAHSRRAAGGGEHVSALRDAEREPRRAGQALERVPADRRALARHRARAERQPAACATSGHTSTPAAASTSTCNALWDAAPPALVQECICGDIMAGLKGRRTTARCSARRCVPDAPVGACMVSSEGTCRIWHEYGGHPDLGVSVAPEAAMITVRDDRITMKCGAGGRAMRALIRDVFIDGLVRDAGRRRHRARGAGRWRGNPDREPVAGGDDRLACDPAAVLSRRRHRPACRSPAPSTTSR